MSRLIINTLQYLNTHSSMRRLMEATPVLTNKKPVLVIDIESYEGKWSDGSEAGNVWIGCLEYGSLSEPKEYYFFNRDSTKVKQEFASFLQEKYKDYVLLHYTESDLEVIPKGYRTFDVHPLVRQIYETEPSFRFFGFYKFGLKHISKLLFGDLYSTCNIQNGKECSAAIYHADRYGWESPRGKQLYDEIKEYNRIDLYATAYLYEWINNNLQK